MKINNIIFDLDGTLIDSAPDIQICLEKAYRTVLSKDVAFDIRQFIGPPMINMIENITPSLTELQIEIVYKYYRVLYDNCFFEHSVSYPGIKEFLKWLSSINCKFYIVTNKPQKSSQLLVKSVLKTQIETISSDSSPNQGVFTKTQMVASLIRKHQIDTNETLLIGDTDTDICAAHDNSIKAVAVFYGYGNKDALRLSKPDFFINSIEELKRLMVLEEGLQ